MSTPAYFNHLRQLLKENNIPDALKSLEKKLEEDPRKDTIIILQARYAQLTQSNKEGTITMEEFRVTQTRITKGITYLISELEAEV